VAKSTLKPEEHTSNWYKDRYQYVLVQRRVLSLITIIALGCTLASVLVIMSLIPQKTIEPYVIQVDQKSGITQYVNPVEAGNLTSNEAVKNYFIVNYIRAREGYSATDIVKQYDSVRIMSEPSRVYAGFLAEANANNSESNVARLGSAGIRQVRIKSISYLEPQVAQVRVLIEERSAGVSVTAQYHKIIVVKFEFAKMSLNQEERYVNPLGFRVIDYRVDEDVVS
jgi:type IV secretion system protein VirB8